MKRDLKKKIPFNSKLTFFPNSTELFIELCGQPPPFIHSDLYITQRRAVISFQKWNLIIPSRTPTPKTFFLGQDDSIYMKGGSGVFSKTIPTGQIRRMTDGRFGNVHGTVSLLHGKYYIINMRLPFFSPSNALSCSKKWGIFPAINQVLFYACTFVSRIRMQQKSTYFLLTTWSPFK